MKLTAFGVHGWMPHNGLLTSCLVIETDTENIVLDMGSGFAKIFNYPKILNKGKPTEIFLSHAHLDHTNGLFFLFALPEESNITLTGSKETLEAIQPLLDAPLSVPPGKLEKKVNLLQREVMLSEKVVNFLPLKHSVPCIGYRFSVQDKTIAYCTDTGICPNLFELAKNSDVLITECTWTDPTFADAGHLNPIGAAKVAQKAKVKKLILTHFTGNRDNGPMISFANKKSIKEAGEIAKKIFPNTIALIDGMALEI